MPLTRHKVANEYSLGGRDLYRRADQHDPEALLDGVAMAGLVGALRQLGDLAEFAAQVFHGLSDEVMTVSARGHGLMLRVQQLEAELPLVEKDSCHADYLYIASNRGIYWHSNLRLDNGVVTKGDTPRFIMDSIKQCHGPPKLFMLDKYDIGGEGACLKRYTDPSFFKTDSACSSMLEQGIQRERRPLRAMEIRPILQNSEIFRPPNAANNDSKLETDLSGKALDKVPTGRRQLKYRQLNGSLSQSFRQQVQNLYRETSPDEKPCSMNHSEVQISFTDSPDTNTEERDIMVDTFSSMDKSREDNYVMHGNNRSIPEEALSRSSDARSTGRSKGYNSEVDIYVDALTTMDSEVETDTENRDHGHVFEPVESSKSCSDVHVVVVSGSISFRNNGSTVPNSEDVVPAKEEKDDHHQEYVCIPSPQAKPVSGEHERRSSLEELFAQERPVYCEHERTSSVEELLVGDVHASEPNMRTSATESNTNGSVSSAATNDALGTIKKEKDNLSIAAISFKKTASKQSKYVGGMELIASKVGILPRKLSKKQDLFSDSLRNMAKQLLELKINSTEETELYEFEANGDGCDMKCLEISRPPIKIMENAMQTFPSDSPQDNIDSRKCKAEEVNQEYDHDVPPSDSPQDSVDGHAFQDIALLSSQEEQQCAGAVTDNKLLDHTPEHTQDKIGEHLYREVTEGIYTEVVPENVSDIGEELKEGSISEGNVNEEDAEESNESDIYALDEETEYIEGQVVSDDLVSSPISSNQSDDPCQITPLALSDADDTVAGKSADNDISGMHITLSGTITESDVSTVVVESVTTNDVAMHHNEQWCLHPETTLPQDLTPVNNCEVVGQNEPLPLCSSSMVGGTPDLSVDSEEMHENPNMCNDNSTNLFRDALAPDSKDVPLPNISSFDWMLNGVMQKSLNVLPAKTHIEILHENYSSEDTEDAPPPLPPLPPMQWRATKLQRGSAPLSAKFGKPPRPKPPVKCQENESYSSQDKRNQDLQEVSLQNGLTPVTLEEEMVVATVSNEVQKNTITGGDSEESHLKRLNEYDVQVSNPFSASEYKSVGVPSVEGDSLETSQLSELIVIPEETWSELVDVKSIPGQEKGAKHQLSTGVFDCYGMHANSLSTENRDQYKGYDQKKKEFSAEESNTIADSLEKKPNGVTPDTQNPDFSVQKEDREYGSYGTARELSSSEEAVAKLSPHRVPEPPKYPQLQVTSHDRSMLKKAPTLVPSIKLLDEKSTIWGQIKNKSFNLKPVLAKRPNVMGAPRTNLQVVAILERANAIRQAVADDDDEDSWSE
uniref:Protein SCAR n=1 Tax=Oryza brachyantha TaxID=4533 RepID=J3LMX4_ORYBR